MEFEDFKEREFKEVAEAMFYCMAAGGRGENGEAWSPWRGKAIEACDRALERIGNDMVKPMSANAERYVALLRERENVTPDEVSRALASWGKNHQAARAIIDRAHELGFKGFDATRDEQLYHAFEIIKSDCKTMRFKAESGKVEERDGYKMLGVALKDWANYLKGYESILGNAVEPLRVPREEVGA